MVSGRKRHGFRIVSLSGRVVFAQHGVGCAWARRWPVPSGSSDCGHVQPFCQLRPTAGTASGHIPSPDSRPDHGWVRGSAHSARHAGETLSGIGHDVVMHCAVTSTWHHVSDNSEMHGASPGPIDLPMQGIGMDFRGVEIGRPSARSTRPGPRFLAGGYLDVFSGKRYRRHHPRNQFIDGAPLTPDPRGRRPRAAGPWRLTRRPAAGVSSPSTRGA